MIKKIRNLKLSITPEQIQNEWNEVKSIRNRLLQNSDWIFVQDNNLEETIISLWVAWRKNVRRVDEFTDIGKALIFLKDLQENTPPLKYKNHNYNSIESYKFGLTKLLKTIINDSIDMIHITMDSREILIEKFEEATKFLTDNKIATPFIDIQREYSGKSKRQIANQFIKDRQNYILKLITVEKVKNNYLYRIEHVENIQQCDIIRDDLQVLGSKTWI